MLKEENNVEKEGNNIKRRKTMLKEENNIKRRKQCLKVSFPESVSIPPADK